MKRLVLIAVLVPGLLSLELIFGSPGASALPNAARWGADGHRMAARAAVQGLPDDMPAFFRSAGDQLVYLNPEPDRWRNGDRREMDQAFSYDHYVDIENVPEGGFDARDRFEFLKLLYEAGLPKPERDVGFLYFHILELYQRIVTGWELREAASGEERRWIEARILNDAGILGHYVTDASQPHHTTIHFNGWNASGVTKVANPEGFTESRDFHARFETRFVREHVVHSDVSAALRDPRPVPDVRSYTLDHIRESNSLVVRLYQLEKQYGFESDSPPDPAEVEFAVERLGSGASALRDLWMAAWREGTGR